MSDRETRFHSPPIFGLAALRRLTADPRHYQIAVLGSLLVYGVTFLGFDVQAITAATLLASTLGVQWICGRIVGLPRFDGRSPLISGFSLCLLLRTESLLLAFAAAAITVGSKFLIRVRGKHVFNPTNFGLVVALLLFDGVWVSPGQWGTGAWLAFLLAGIGMLVTYRAERFDVTWAFLAAWALCLFGRAWYLGDPWSIPLRQIQSGAFLVFAFFMISDPKTTPDSRLGRVVYAACVAGLAAYIQFVLYQPNALILALVACAVWVPLLDRLWPALPYVWPSASSRSAREAEKESENVRIRPVGSLLDIRMFNPASRRSA